MLKSLLLVAAVAAGSSAAFAGDVATGAAPTVIVIKNMEFSLSMLTVAPGTTVIWVNEDESPHTITDKGKVFRSAAMDTNDRFSYTFAQPGEFTYYCTLHPMMIGKIVVKDVVKPGGASS
jgi:plastocyanin